MNIFHATPVAPGRYALVDQEARHCLRALRKQLGDEVFAIDGEGLFLRAIISRATTDSAELEVLQTIAEWGEPPLYVTLGISLLKDRDRFEWVVEKAVELGVSEIVPLRATHTEKYGSKLRLDRLNAILLSATKQCKRSRMPALRPVQDIGEWLPGTHHGCKWIAYCETSTPALWPEPGRGSSVAWLIGPEGDFASAEVDAAKQFGFQPVSLGQTRLRAETAALYALAWTKAFGGF